MPPDLLCYQYGVTMNRSTAQKMAKRRPATTRVAVTIRLPEDIVEKIDSELELREVPISRNNWLLEAAIEKLHRNNLRESNGTQ